jgi:HSP20 family molecular chaperone IbpA
VGRPAGEALTQAPGPALAPDSQQVHLTPPIDIHEEADRLILDADLPGATETTLTIQLEENVLSLHARVPTSVPQGARTLYEEYRAGDYYRSFILSNEIDRSRITAELKHGVLRLILPKAARNKSRRIEIKSPSNSSS